MFIQFNKSPQRYQTSLISVYFYRFPFTLSYPLFILLLTFLDFISLCNNHSAVTFNSTPLSCTFPYIYHRGMQFHRHHFSLYWLFSSFFTSSVIPFHLVGQ